MSKLTLEDAISHCLEVAEQKEHDSITTTGDYELDIAMKEGCIQCAADHRQLAEWLMEYKDLKAEQNDQYVFIRELMNELTEAKRLLKLAVEDFTAIAEVHAASTPILCPQYEKYMKAIDVRTRKWRYADEALALIGKDTNVSTTEGDTNVGHKQED